MPHDSPNYMEGVAELRTRWDIRNNENIAAVAEALRAAATEAGKLRAERNRLRTVNAELADLLTRAGAYVPTDNFAEHDMHGEIRAALAKAANTN